MLIIKGMHLISGQSWTHHSINQKRNFKIEIVELYHKIIKT